MANLTVALQRLFDNWDPKPSKKHDYICNCGDNFKKGKLNYLRHMKAEHEPEFEELHNQQLKKVKEAKANQQNHNIQHQQQINYSFQNDHVQDEEDNDEDENKEETIEEILDKALQNISEESTDSENSSANRSTVPKGSHDSRQIENDYEAIAKKLAKLTKKWKKGGLNAAQYFDAVAQIVQTQKVIEKI